MNLGSTERGAGTAATAALSEAHATSSPTPADASKDLDGKSPSASPAGPRIALSERVIAHIQDIGLPALLSDSDCRIVAINRQAAALLDQKAEPGAALPALAQGAGAASDLMSVWQARCSLGAGWSHECKLLGKLEALVDLQLVVMPVSVAGTGDQVWLVVLQDLTETLFHARELEIYATELSQLYQKNKQDLQKLEEAQRSREQFFSLVTHELKTPLTSLKAALEILCTPEVIPTGFENAWRLADTMKRSAFRLERLMNDVLDVAAARSGGMDFSFEAVDLCDVIDTVVSEMTPVANEKGVLLTGPEKYKSGLVVRGDDVRLQQVFLNLTSNAIKATPPDGTVRIRAARSAGAARVSVTNPGELPEHVRNGLFEPFRKSSVGGYKAGAGLGLTVVQALVNAHNGAVEATSRRKQVVFTVIIPLWGKASSQ
ncbi:MAG: HAMP domain-containing histidine kinase [Chloroflexi bacterium]|nr:HAMP domain-containing histidine kinase [Chloroflexota bacterium]